MSFRRKISGAAMAKVLAILLTALILNAGRIFAQNAQDPPVAPPATKPEPRVIYPKETKLDFDDAKIEGEIKNPGEFYFQHRPEDKFDSLVKRRKDFHREMLRDVVLSK